MIKRILLFFTTILIASNIAQAVTTNRPVDTYITELLQQASLVLDSKQLTLDEKVKQAQALIAANLDFKWMALYSLGKYRKTLNEQQITEFIQVYSKYVVKTYVDLIKGHQNDRTKILKVQQLGDKEFVIVTQVTNKTERPPMQVEYLVHDFTKGDKLDFKIFDIITEGISIVNSQRAEFDSVINSYGFDVLFSRLKSKL